MDNGYKYGVPHEAPEGRVQAALDEQARAHEVPVEGVGALPGVDFPLEQKSVWNLTLSNGTKLEIIDWVPREEGMLIPYSEPLLRITPGGEGAEPMDIEGPDIDAFLLVVRQLRPDHNEMFPRDVHPALRRRALKAYKKFEDKPRPMKYKSNKD